MTLLARTFPDEIRAAIAKYPEGRQASAVLNLLYLAQAAYGRITAEAIGEVAVLLEMDPTQVRGVVGFYTLLKTEPHGKFVIHYCTDLPCMLRRAGALLPMLCAAVGAEPGETSGDGLFSVEKAMCLAACDRAPMMQINLEYEYDLTLEKIDAKVTELRALATSAPRPAAPFGFGPPSEIAGATGVGERAAPAQADMGERALLAQADIAEDATQAVADIGAPLPNRKSGKDAPNV